MVCAFPGIAEVVDGGEGHACGVPEYCSFVGADGDRGDAGWEEGVTPGEGGFDGVEVAIGGVGFIGVGGESQERQGKECSQGGQTPMEA